MEAMNPEVPDRRVFSGPAYPWEAETPKSIELCEVPVRLVERFPDASVLVRADDECEYVVDEETFDEAPVLEAELV